MPLQDRDKVYRGAYELLHFLLSDRIISALAQAKGLSSPVLRQTWTPREEHERGKCVMLLPDCFQLWVLPELLQPMHAPTCGVASGDHSPEPVLQALRSQCVSATICPLWVSRLCWPHW